jgi:hypothetical protein
MDRANQDKLLTQYRALREKQGNLINFVPGYSYGQPLRIDQILRGSIRIAAAKEYATLLRRELLFNDSRVTLAEYQDARRYYRVLTLGDLWSSYEHAGDSLGEDDFQGWLVDEVAESRYCKRYDC